MVLVLFFSRRTGSSYRSGIFLFPTRIWKPFITGSFTMKAAEDARFPAAIVYPQLIKEFDSGA
jgi:hypothetical protein